MLNLLREKLKIIKCKISEFILINLSLNIDIETKAMLKKFKKFNIDKSIC